MVHKSKLLASGPSKLSQILEHLNVQPKLSLNSLRSLRLNYAYRNDHFGARHFVKEHLPRIRYANPTVDIRVEKVHASPQDVSPPELKVEFENGTVYTINMHGKWSAAILKELMDLGGGNSWSQWKSQARASGQPVIPGEENENPSKRSQNKSVLAALEMKNGEPSHSQLKQ